MARDIRFENEQGSSGVAERLLVVEELSNELDLCIEA
jgi:hypothetical protein